LDCISEGLGGLIAIIKTCPTKRMTKLQVLEKLLIDKFGQSVLLFLLRHNSPKEATDLARRDPKLP
jgi:hypothetical protein